MGYWSRTKTKYAIMVLPLWGDLSVAGLTGTLSSVGLLRGDVPRCLLVDRARGVLTGWANGYEDGGPFETKREYPVFYFDHKG